jgi:hypothetical protein
LIDAAREFVRMFWGKGLDENIELRGAGLVIGVQLFQDCYIVETFGGFAAGAFVPYCVSISQKKNTLTVFFEKADGERIGDSGEDF